MCGRAAQTVGAVYAAAHSLGVAPQAPQPAATQPHNESASLVSTSFAQHGYDVGKTTSSTSLHAAKAPAFASTGEYEWKSNWNMSPGMDGMVFFKDESSSSFAPTIDRDRGSFHDARKIVMDRKVWGLVTRGGSSLNPLDLKVGPNRHFEGLMFNARADTLFSKPTFASLTSLGRSCLIAMDGFFEWKQEVGQKKKQPYYVYRKKNKKNDETNNRPYLLMAGLWTSVPTGQADKPTLETFTIITTEACESLQWLHTRMPVCISEEDAGSLNDENSLARKWLDGPSESVLRQLEANAKSAPASFFDWHKVTTDMSSLKYRSDDAIKPLPKMKTVKSFFAPVSADSNVSKRPAAKSTAATLFGTTKSQGKRCAPTPSKRKSPNNKKTRTLSTERPEKQKGTLHAFFAPKEK